LAHVSPWGTQLGLATEDVSMKNTLTGFRKSRVIMLALVFTFALMAHAADDKKLEEQKDVRNVAQKVLEQLYTAEPEAKAAVENAAGYAVFNNMGVKILFAGSGKGKGMAVDNKTKKETFMKMVELQAGFGIG
jgi:hypothetical protein